MKYGVKRRRSKAKEPFPPGSLKKYVTKEDNEERLAILKGCTLERRGQIRARIRDVFRLMVSD